MRCPALTLSLGLAACTGAHYEVGRMDPQDAVADVGGSSFLPGSGVGGSSGRPMGMATAGSTFGGGSTTPDNPKAGAPNGGDPGAVCATTEPPAALTGPFQAPQEVWSRLSSLLFDQKLSPPSTLPPQTTYAWAGQIVTQLFEQTGENDAMAPGAASFVQTWIGLGRDAEPLSKDWGGLLLAEAPALQLLLEMPLTDSKRVGIFTEPAWLKQYPVISTRGYIMAQAVLGLVIPPEPGNVKDRTDPTPSPGYSQRQQLEASVAYSSCQACHRLIDPLGVSLEHFDGNGQYRTVDAAQPVDSSGTYTLQRSGRSIGFDDFAELGSQLAEDCEANLGFASRYLALGLSRVGVPDDELQTVYDHELPRFQQAFMAGGKSYSALVRAFAQSAAVLERPPG